MNWSSSRVYLLVVAVVSTFCSVPEGSGEQVATVQEARNRSSSAFLMEVTDLENVINLPGYRLIDFRKPEDYAKGHLPGAINIWRPDIEDRAWEYGGMMASRQQLEALFSEKGIHPTDTLIVYDDNGLCDAARLWWVLQNQNFHAVKLMHGGFRSWMNLAESVSVDSPVSVASDFRFNLPPENRSLITKEEVLVALDEKRVIVDARSSDEYSGKRQKRGASRGGRIPGSIHIDWASAIDYEGDLSIKPIQELQQVYQNLPENENELIIVYCHSGVRSAHTTFVLTQMLGYKNVKNYDGSWTEWSYYDDLPIEKDSLTTIIDQQI